ncbi:TatD family hydrolase [Mesorhizobium sp. M0622]
MAAEDANRAGVYVLSVTTTPKAWRKTAALAKGKPRIRTALGLHPELAGDRIGELALFEALATETRYFGEIGLDGSPQFKPTQDLQLRAFEFILRTASTMGGKILSIHSRRAAGDVLDVLARFPSSGTPILHWFSGNSKELQRAIGQGCWFSVGPAMLRTRNGRTIAQALPRNRVLTETDGPFAMDRSRPLQPVDAWMAVEELGRVWNLDSAAMHYQLRENLRVLSASVPNDVIHP